MSALTTIIDPRMDDHERRITALEQGMTSIQLKLVEVQTEVRLRGESQDRELRDLKAMISALLVGMRFFKWAGGFAFSVLMFAAVYGERLLSLFRVIHP